MNSPEAHKLLTGVFSSVLSPSDHSGVQLLHLYPLHPPRAGQTAGCRADVLGGDAAPQGNVPRQARLLQRPAVTGAVLQSQRLS